MSLKNFGFSRSEMKTFLVVEAYLRVLNAMPPSTNQYKSKKNKHNMGPHHPTIPLHLRMPWRNISTMPSVSSPAKDGLTRWVGRSSCRIRLKFWSPPMRLPCHHWSLIEDSRKDTRVKANNEVQLSSCWFKATRISEICDLTHFHGSQRVLVGRP